jgi:hypothetical protein
VFDPNLLFGLASRFTASRIPDSKTNACQANRACCPEHHAGRHGRQITIEQGHYDERGEQDPEYGAENRKRASPV